MRVDRLVRIVRRLRARNGCPWDRRQNHRSLRANLLEETYEVLDAIDRNSAEALKEELGDLLMQIVFHSVIAEERGKFRLADAVRHVCDKLVRRHPHVFSRPRRGRRISAAGALRQWERLKHAERPARSGLAGVPPALPALLRAARLQNKAARLGYGPAAPGERRLGRELASLRKSLQSGFRIDSRRLGGMLFFLVRLACLRRTDAEGALQAANRGFIRRFAKIERHAARSGRSPSRRALRELWGQG